MRWTRLSRYIRAIGYSDAVTRQKERQKMQEQVSTLLTPLPPDLLSVTIRAFADGA